MFYDGMLTFLSRDNIMLHLSFLEKLKLKYSILEKSYEGIKGKTLVQIPKLRIPIDVREEAIATLSEIESHNLYFSSFSDKTYVCKEIREYYSSEEAFLYEIFEEAVKSKGNFLFVCRDGRGKPMIFSDKSFAELYQKYKPLLALDLCEHSYFIDYGFDREEYLRRAVGKLDLLKLIKT